MLMFILFFVYRNYNLLDVQYYLIKSNRLDITFTCN